MARYTINYLTGHAQTIEAKYIEPSGDQYVGWAGDGSACAYIPIANVLSVVLTANETQSAEAVDA
ncbi:hypothetical protein AB0M57_04695 [Streptomyces sp. NPDC051597]|uniref:hypothetical protein n=1 Tax=Streptomyces sp. NPDC051597 TaxID=3155049 RepID=UPI0034206009